MLKTLFILTQFKLIENLAELKRSEYNKNVFKIKLDRFGNFFYI